VFACFVIFAVLTFGVLAKGWLSLRIILVMGAVLQLVMIWGRSGSVGGE